MTSTHEGGCLCGQVRNRGGMFDVIEVWIERCFLIEALTPVMQAQRLVTLAPDRWRRALSEMPMAA